MKTVAEVIGVSRSNLVERLQQRPPRRIGRPPLPDEELVAQIKAARNGQPLEGLQFLKRDIANNVLTAKGAFNVGPQWFPLDYRCEVNVDRYIVTDFRFDIKPELSTDEVRRLGLRSQ